MLYDRMYELENSTSTETAEMIYNDVKDTISAASLAALPHEEKTAAIYGTVALWASAAEALGHNDAA